MTAYKPNEFQWWKDKLAGKDVPAYPDVPMQGFYRYRSEKGGRYVPVRIWYAKEDPSVLLGAVDGKAANFIADIWQWCLDNPVTFDAYKAVVENGEPWPDEMIADKASGDKESTHTKAGIGHNSGDKDFDTITGNIDEWSRQADKAAKKGAPTTAAEADVMSDIMTKLSELAGEGDKARLSETKPLRDKVDDINSKWNRFINQAKEKIPALRKLVKVWQDKESERRAEEAKKLAATAGDGVQIEAAKVTSGTRRKVSSVTRSVVVIDDLKKVAAYLAEMETPPVNFQKECEIAAYRLLGAGVSVPGARLTKSATVA